MLAFSVTPMMYRKERTGSASPNQGKPDGEQHPELSRPEKLDCMSRQRLMQVASDCGVRFEITWTKAQLKQAIIEVMDDNGA